MHLQYLCALKMRQKAAKRNTVAQGRLERSLPDTRTHAPTTFSVATKTGKNCKETSGLYTTVAWKAFAAQCNGNGHVDIDGV